MFGCGCGVSASMFGDHEITGVTVCLKHSLDNRMHMALKHLYGVAGSTTPDEFRAPAVQAVLVHAAALIQELLDEERAQQ